MRNFSKKLAFVLAAAMVFTAFAPAAKAEAAEDMAINRKSQTLYVNEGVNHKGAETLPEGLYGNVCEYDFYVANKPADWKTAYTFDWSSSNEKVMTVGKAGLATAVAPGKADVVCVVTEKATGKATKLTATVTVKANAEDITITNAADFDMQSVVAGDEVALEYAVFAPNGIKPTDLVRWVAEPATGVTVEDGVFTFGEDAVAGDYTLYAETYQSEKYNQPTATSEKIVVTFVTDNSFEVKQDTVKKFTVTFDAPVKSVGEVTVNRLYKGFELPALVKSATLAEDGMSATVEMYAALKNNEEYAITIAGYETYTLTASAGDPVEVLIYVDAKAVGTDAELISIDATAPAPVELKYVLLDAKGVDVTDVAGGTVLFNAKEYATDGSYYVSGTQMWFAKDGVEIEVTADYQSGRYDNAGNQLAPAKGEKLFYSMEKEPVQVVGLADWKIAGGDDWKDAKKTVPFGVDALLAVKLKLTEGDPVEAVLGSQVPVVGGTIKFEEINPDVAAMSGNEIVYFKQGVAKILVYYVDVEGNELPIAQINAETTAPVALRNIKVEKTVNTVGTVANYDLLEVKVTAEDNYNGAFLVAGNVSVEGIDNNAKAVVDADLFDIEYSDDAKTATIKANGAEMLDAVNAVLANDVTTVQLSFKVVVNDAAANKKVEQNFTVLLKSRGAANTEYLQIEATGFGGDVARTEASPNVKSASFTVYQYSNGIKVGTQEIQAYPANADDITADAFYFKVTKDGKDITAKVIAQDKSVLAAGKVAFDFSGKDVNGVVDYTDFGGGNYAFTLYKGVDVAGKGVAVQQNSSVGAVTCNVGAYSNAVRVKDSLGNSLDPADILAAFTIKDTKGEAATSEFTVDTEVTDKYVFVKSFTFSDNLGDAVAKYTVNVGIALLK